MVGSHSWKMSKCFAPKTTFQYQVWMTSLQSGVNQETSLVRLGDTRWGSHYTTFSRIESMWDAVIEVLGIVEDDVRVPCRAGGLVHQMETFSFVFILKMMLKILRITNDLSLLLQKKDQNVVQVCEYVMDHVRCI